MAFPTAATPDTDRSQLLSRLSSEMTVQSVLLLSRETGAIIRATGLITCASVPDYPLVAEYAAAIYRYIQASEELMGLLEAIDGGVLGGIGVENKNARTERGEEDGKGPERYNVRLLEIRTRRRELVVVPDARFVLIVSHDTPLAP